MIISFSQAIPAEYRDKGDSMFAAEVNNRRKYG